MLLFPGEEDFCGDGEGWRIIPAGKDLLLICPGACERENRPLACRMFPLLPLWRDGAVKVAMDARSRAVCPLAEMGLRGLREDFRAVVRRCGELLAEDAGQRAFLIRLTRTHDELRALRRELMPSPSEPSRHEGGDRLV